MNTYKSRIDIFGTFLDSLQNKSLKGDVEQDHAKILLQHLAEKSDTPSAIVSSLKLPLTETIRLLHDSERMGLLRAKTENHEKVFELTEEGRKTLEHSL